MATTVTHMDWAPANDFGHSATERILPICAMIGAIGGAVGGAVLAADAGTLAAVWGTLGSILVSAAAAGSGFLAARLWTRGPLTVVCTNSHDAASAAR